MKLMSQYKGGVTNRRVAALSRLEKQLKLGVKMPKKSFLTLDYVPLEEKDVKRIKSEISMLKSKI